MNDRGLAENSVAGVRRYLQVMLSSVEDRERDQMITTLFRHVMGWSKADMIMRLNDRLSESEILALHKLSSKIRKGVPIQYATGRAHFFGREFRVDNRVLIPRPETEELVQLVLDRTTSDKKKVLDIGTGSGCIAISLKLERPQWHVEGIDLSTDALELASINAKNLGAGVAFSEVNVLLREPQQAYDIIVSNPPYIAASESSSMQPNVLDHEPHIALFVPSEDPLLFYRRIAEIGLRRLNKRGCVFVECNERLAYETADLFRSGYHEVTVIHDLQGKPRMVYAALDAE